MSRRGVRISVSVGFRRVTRKLKTSWHSGETDLDIADAGIARSVVEELDTFSLGEWTHMVKVLREQIAARGFMDHPDPQFGDQPQMGATSDLWVPTDIDELLAEAAQSVAVYEQMGVTRQVDDWPGVGSLVQVALRVPNWLEERDYAIQRIHELEAKVEKLEHDLVLATKVKTSIPVGTPRAARPVIVGEE